MIENRSKLEITQTETLETSVTETESNFITNAKEYSYTETFGLDVMVQDILKVNEITVHLGFEASQVFQTAYAQEHEVSKDKKNSSSAELILPPYTSIMVRKTESGAVTTLDYDCPVMVQFDVVVVSMCGTFYDDNAAVQAFSTAGYDQDDVPFYGFKSRRGEWILVNEDGEQVKDGEIAEIRTEKLTNNIYIIGKATGVVYAKYLIPEDFYTYSNGRADSVYQNRST